MSIVCNSSDLNNIDKATPTNYQLVFPKIPTESTITANNPFVMNIFSAIIPSLSIAVQELHWQGNKARYDLSPMEFDPWLVSFVVDSRIANWSLLFNWMSYINNNWNKIAEYHIEYAVDVSMVITDNYKNTVMELIFVDIWPSMLGEISFSQREGDVQLESTVNFNYDYFYVRDTTTWPVEFSSSSSSWSSSSKSSSSSSLSSSSSSSSSLSSSSSSSSSSLSSSSSSSSSSLSSSSESIYSSSSSSFTPVELFYTTIPSNVYNSRNYPVLLKLPSGSGIVQAAELAGLSHEYLHITKDSDSTEYYAEVVDWDTQNYTAIIWFAMPLSTTDRYVIKVEINTINNSTYVGLKGTTPAQRIWSDDGLGSFGGYKQVIHFNEPSSASTFYDSTVNGNNITNVLPVSAWTNDTPVGNGWHFNGVNQQLDTGVNRGGDGTAHFDVLFKADFDPQIGVHSGPVHGKYNIVRWNDESIPARGWTLTAGPSNRYTNFSATASGGVWYYLGFQMDGSSPGVQLNDIIYDDGGATGTILTPDYNMGLAGNVSVPNTYCWAGYISEFRVSSNFATATILHTNYNIMLDNILSEGSFSSSSTSSSSSSNSSSSSSSSFSINPLLLSEGGTITVSGGYRIHTFTVDTDSAFILNEARTVDYFIVGGGGATGNNNCGAGGGAGGVVSGSAYITPNLYPVIVGDGGVNPSTEVSSYVGNGENSTVFGITASGGGQGGHGGSGGDEFAHDGRNGGSGGGGAGVYSYSYGNPDGGLSISGQGFDGGIGLNTGTTAARAAGGGGGAGELGEDAVAYNGGDGGIGVATNIRGYVEYFAGGGGGSTNNSTGRGLGGIGGGGDGSDDGNLPQNGTPYTGGGGGGRQEGDQTSGLGNGGSGIVIIRVPIV